jgi:hypothetical protein
MRKIQIVGLLLFSVFALSAVAASSALAEEVKEWLDNNAAISVAVPVLSELMTDVLLEYMPPPGHEVEKTEVECMVGDGEGTVGPGAVGKVTKAECLEALTVSGACAAPITITADNLPWRTELYLEGTMFRVLLLEEGTNGVPGFHLECETLLGLHLLLCTGFEESALLENDGTTGTVLGEADEVSELQSETSKCINGASEEGLKLILAGADSLIFAEDSTLSITVSSHP